MGNIYSWWSNWIITFFAFVEEGLQKVKLCSHHDQDYSQLQNSEHLESPLMVDDDIWVNGLFFFLEQLISADILQLFSHLDELGVKVIDLTLDC